MDIRREILRNVILCQALAPLAKKPGIARSQELSGSQLESLIVAGVNSSWCFHDLAERILRNGGQPEHIYDLAWEALSASGRNRQGNHNVNYGQIALLVPLVTAQVLEYLDKGSCDVEAILVRTGEVLRQTSPQDVESLEKFVRLGYELSARQRERNGGTPKPSGPPVLQSQYGNVWEAMRDYQQIYVVRETFQGYPNSLQVHRYLLHNLDEGLLSSSEMIYRVLLAELRHADAVADMLAAGLYLTLMSHPESVLFP